MSIMKRDEVKIKTGLVIMASGLSKRFGSNKLMEILDDKPLIKWVIDVTDGLFDKRIVVTRSIEVYDLCEALNVNCILHELPLRNDTVRLGLKEIIKDIDYCFFMQGDQPLISKESIEKMIFSANDFPKMIVKAGYHDTVGAPMGFPRCLFNELLALPEGKGGNYVAKIHPNLVYTVEVKKEYELWDIDISTDLERIRNVLKLNM